tara:strand:+ start:1556 stop:2497 length:942 start_codon:yes stop_codon:yes gene_type:complete
MNNIKQFSDYLEKQGLFKMIQTYVSGYSYQLERGDELKKINSIGFETPQDLMEVCVNHCLQLANNGQIDFNNDDKSDFSNFLKACQSLNISCEKDTYMYSILRAKANSLYSVLMQSIKSSSIGYSDRESVNVYSKIISIVGLPEDDSHDLEGLMSSIINGNRWSVHSFSDAMANFVSILAKQDYNNIKDKYLKTVKKLKAHRREPIFIGVIRSGKLDKKTARKMRSDASESVSHNCIEELFKCSNLYSDEEFQRLFTQFGDSPYYQVRMYLAKNVHPKQLMCLMGTSCDQTKRVMMQRIKEYYETLEKENDCE